MLPPLLCCESWQRHENYYANHAGAEQTADEETCGWPT